MWDWRPWPSFSLCDRWRLRPYSNHPCPPPANPTPVKPFDFDRDVDNDGVPDELESALAELDNLSEQAESDPEAEATYRAALQRFSSRLPYTAKTRGMQARLWAANERLLKAKSDETAFAIMAEMRDLEAKMQQDPTFATTDRVLRKRLRKELQAKEERQRANGVLDRLAPRSPATSRLRTAVWSIYLPALNAGGVPATTPTEPCTPSNTAGNGQALFASLQAGDVLFASGANKINNYFYAMQFSHIGMYHGTIGGIRKVYESNPQNDAAGIPNGAWTLPLDRWFTSGNCVGLAQPNFDPNLNPPITRLDVQAALGWAEGKYGKQGETIYNWNFATKTGEVDVWSGKYALYCSQLVWKIFDHLAIDVDSNNDTYRTWLVSRYPVAWTTTVTDLATATVAPDEIALSSRVVTYSEGTNP